MSEILKEWLTQRLQRTIKWEAEEFGDMMKNGYIIAEVLRNYHIINDEKFYVIRTGNNSTDIKNNWKVLSIWLREVDINLNDSELNNVMEGRGSALLRLFYQLFLHLDKKDRTDFIKHENKMVSRLVEKMNTRFRVDRVYEEEEPFIDDLAKPLLDERHFIEWQRKKAEQVKETYDYMRHKYLKTLACLNETKTPLQLGSPSARKIPEKDKKAMDEFGIKYPSKFTNYTYEELLNLEEKATQRRKTLVDSEWVNNYLNNLYVRLHKKSDSEEFQRQISNSVSSSIWDMTVAEEESKLDTELAKKVMKLSQFEKQMCSQIMETKQQARNLAKNRIEAEKQFVDQRTQQFNLFLDNVKEEINLGLAELDFEKKRQNMLHKKLYAEKMKRKRQHYHEICYETMLSIVDYATKYGYFKRLIGDDIPDHFIHEWKMLYYKKQPIFDILEPMEKILQEKAEEEEFEPQEEEIIRLELDRQEALNKGEFIEYHNYSYPWTLESLIPNYNPESDERKYEYLGMRILGHVVYTLLETKYPYPPLRPPADLPKYTAKAILRGLPDKSITVAMQTLLKSRQIHVVRLESAINFCLRQFKREMIGCIDIDLSFDKFMGLSQDEDEKELIRSMKVEDDILNKSNEANFAAISGPIPANVKQTQTPKTIPEEEIILSDGAYLGRYAYEALGSGESLTDHLVAAIIIEYLKYQEDINGFVIINYPNSYRQAQILEETFSGREPPDEEELSDSDDIYLEESISKHRKIEKDPYKYVRVSKLVGDPHKKRIDTPFESYFSCYLRLKETEDILQEMVIWDLTTENSEFIDRFYAVLGINYSMYYEVIEKDLLAQICKYIIGDFSMPLMSCDHLFGENVLSLLDFPSSDDKRTKSKIVKPEVSNIRSKDKIRRSSKISHLSLSNDLEIIKEPELVESVPEESISIVEHMIEEEIVSKSTTSFEEMILAGEEGWIYGELPIPETIGPALATCWEEIEKNYIHDFEQLLFAKRLQMNCLVPYARFIKDKMEQIITLPSCKQDLVNSFQKNYNDFENDWRDIHLTKNEWHCRVKELQNSLYNICDERKIVSQNHLQALISENWTMEELTTMVNTYISCLQTELNRSILTYQMLHDFYFTMIKRSPPNERLFSKELFKIFKETDETSGSKRGGEDKIYRQLKNAFLDLQMKNIEINYSNNPFNAILENNVKFALKVIKEINDSYRSLISKEYTEIAKISPSPKRKDELTSVESINAEEIFKENALKCIEEWSMGINGEMFRASLRVMALQYKCYQDMKLFNNHIYKTFLEVQNDINNYYLNEIKSVDRLCKYLQMAVEGGKRIPESLLLENDTFIIDPNLLQFSSPEVHLDVGKIGESREFKLCQLARLRSQLKTVAPTGIALQQAFIYYLQDFIFYGKESCKGPLFPDTWKRIDPEQVPKLVYLIFGDTAYVDWKDFLIYCLDLRYPTIDELLQIRKDFRCKDIDSEELISREDFMNIIFWFEEDFDPDNNHDMLKKNLIKHFLFELFEVSEDMVNYSALLLAFCKSNNPIEGFALALSMAVGKKICYNLEECQDVICKLIKLKKYKDECMACAHKCTHKFLERVITNVINTCEGTIISELEYTEPTPESDRKGRKGKGSSKTKKAESTMSARLPKTQKSVFSRSKITQSATDVKSTYICRPCEEETEIEVEKVEEKVVVEEEHKSEPQEDPNLVYAVSQSVIWNVLKICLPWHFQLLPEEKVTPYVEQVESLMKRLETDTENNYIYVSRFVADPAVCKILHKAKKFEAINLAQEIQNF